MARKPTPPPAPDRLPNGAPLAPRIGGSFAPPLSEALLEDYRERIEALDPSAVRDALLSLLPCCEMWWDLPEPQNTPALPHPSGVGVMVGLQPDHALALDEHIPWPHEREAAAALFETIHPDTDRDLRNLAFHLLWHVQELSLGREPLTSDKL